MTPRGLVVGAPRSGSGKTTVTLALVAALRRRGLAVRAAKSGPDYIDPAFHVAASGAPVLNLDSWAMPPPLLDGLAHEAAVGASVLVVESAMGLFDGVAGPPGRTGAAADLAARLRLPVLLVLDVSGQSQTAAAVARGFAVHDPAVAVCGVVLNRVGSERHRMGAAVAIEAAGVPVLGALPRDASLALPERHLGLVQAAEHPDLPDLLHRLADKAEQCLDLGAILRHAAPVASPAAPAAALPPPGQRVALAADAAFGFAYAHLVQGWRHAGAEIVRFSPLADEPPPECCDVCWLPGGYPELHGGCLAGAGRFMAGLTRFAETRPVHGECGGHMVLGQGIEDASGARHAMAGLLGHETSFARRKLHLGYREATLLADAPIGAAGAVVRGHEFHYASTVDPGRDAPLAALRDAAGTSLGSAGGRRGHVTGSFFHVIASAARQRGATDFALRATDRKTLRSAPIITGGTAMAASGSFNDAAQDAREQIAQLRAQVQTLMAERVTPALSNAAGTAQDYAQQARDVASDQAEMLSDHVRESPIVAILIAAGAGYLLGRIAR